MEKFGTDCSKCVYGADGGRGTICCCYCGTEECDPYNDCSQFQPDCECYECGKTHKVENMERVDFGWLCKSCFEEVEND